jgi:hypothetical protein
MEWLKGLPSPIKIKIVIWTPLCWCEKSPYIGDKRCLTCLRRTMHLCVVCVFSLMWIRDKYISNQNFIFTFHMVLWIYEYKNRNKVKRWQVYSKSITPILSCLLMFRYQNELMIPFFNIIDFWNFWLKATLD